MPLSRDRLNLLHEYGALCASLSNTAYFAFEKGQAKLAEDTVHSLEDLLETAGELVQQTLSPEEPSP